MHMLVGVCKKFNYAAIILSIILLIGVCKHYENYFSSEVCYLHTVTLCRTIESVDSISRDGTDTMTRVKIKVVYAM